MRKAKINNGVREAREASQDYADEKYTGGDRIGVREQRRGGNIDGYQQVFEAGIQ